VRSSPGAERTHDTALIADRVAQLGADDFRVEVKLHFGLFSAGVDVPHLHHVRVAVLHLSEGDLLAVQPEERQEVPLEGGPEDGRARSQLKGWRPF
jgi:hypothetical protein